ncbi:MAG: hypothetical protein M1812_008151 [Candelaria pacifica]|nr:MAG: hypothetical protein M1812_008151 [Candelaria pacifica]
MSDPQRHLRPTGQNGDKSKHLHGALTHKRVNGAPSPETLNGGTSNDAQSVSGLKGIAGAVAHATAPAWLQLSVMIGLIFGGCCSNVFALEYIVKEDPDSGLLITLSQFLLTALANWPQQFSRHRPPFYLKPNAVPIGRWIINIILFFAVNVLNNYAFGYKISVPVHIILRSGGSVTTMLVGWLWGKRYSRMQVISVALLTIGVVVAAMSDAKTKVYCTTPVHQYLLLSHAIYEQGKASTTSTSNTSSFLTGLSILFLAQVLSAIMGLYIQSTYTIYGSHWQENLFYSHCLGLPLFLPFLPSITTQFSTLSSSPPLALPPTLNAYTSFFPTTIQKTLPVWRMPTKIGLLIANSITQYACIRGVNLLGAKSSALTVTIVLNIRKLASLMLSIWLFGNRLAPGVLVGAVIVFGSGALYAWEGQRMGSRSRGKKVV